MPHSCVRHRAGIIGVTWLHCHFSILELGLLFGPVSLIRALPSVQAEATEGLSPEFSTVFSKLCVGRGGREECL